MQTYTSTSGLKIRKKLTVRDAYVTSNHFVRQVTGNMLGAMIPETDPSPRVDNVDTHGKVFYQMAK